MQHNVWASGNWVGIFFLDQQIGMTTNAVDKREAETWIIDMMLMTDIEMEMEMTKHRKYDSCCKFPLLQHRFVYFKQKKH